MLPLRLNHPDKVTLAETQNEFHALDVIEENGTLFSIWELSEVEKQTIANNGVVRLGIASHRHPGILLDAQTRDGNLPSYPQKSFVQCVFELKKHAIDTKQNATEIHSGYAMHDGLTVYDVPVIYNELLPKNKMVMLAGLNTIGALMFKEMVSDHRIHELLDYATAYGEFDEDTPIGTKTEFGSPMSVERKTAILCFKKVLGLIET